MMKTSTEKGIRLANYQVIVPELTNEYVNIGFVVDNLLFEMEIRGIPIPAQEEYLNNLKEHISVIVLNLYDAYLKDPERYVGYLRRRGAYKRYKGYQGFQFSYHNVRKATDFLKDNGYIEQDNGYPSSDKFERQISQMRATAKLVELIKRDKQVTPDIIKLDISSDKAIVS